jgi:cysteinyl-tRNA synthetase
MFNSSKQEFQFMKLDQLHQIAATTAEKIAEVSDYDPTNSDKWDLTDRIRDYLQDIGVEVTDKDD